MSVLFRTCYTGDNLFTNFKLICFQNYGLSTVTFVTCLQCLWPCSRKIGRWSVLTFFLNWYLMYRGITSLCRMGQCCNVLHISATLQVRNSDFQYFNAFDFILYTCPLTEGNSRQVLIFLKSDKSFFCWMRCSLKYSVKLTVQMVNSSPEYNQ